MAEFARTSGLEIGSLCFDGLMIYKKDGFDLETFLVNMEKYVFNKVGIQLKIVQKEMTEGVDLTGFNIEEDAPYIPLTEEEIGIYIVKKIVEDGNIYYSKKMNLTYVYNPETKLFEESCFEKIMTCISGYIIPLIDSEASLMGNADVGDKKFQGLIKTYEKLRKDLQTTTFQKSILTQIRIRIPDSEEFIEKTLNGTPHLFPIGSNVINLKTLEVIPRTKEHFFTYTTDNTFKSDRPNKGVISNYIGELLKTENQEYITCFLTYLGYCLTNENCMKMFAVFNGDGDNGKSVFFNLFKSIIGDSASVCVADKVFFSANAESVHSDEYLRLIGKRLAYNNEIPDKAHWNEKFIKAVSGNDGKLSLRACGGRTIEPYITSKMISIGNYDQMPTFTDFQGFANRLKIFRFANKFEKNPKKAIEIMSWKDDLFTEMCWFVKNHFYDKEMNIDFPIEVEMATNEAKEDMDTVKGFFEEKVVITENKDDRFARPKLYKQYQGFCIENELHRLMVGRATFNSYIIKNFNLEVHRDREWKGIKMRRDDCDSLMGCPL
jgi:P4 family phage/plasmid primase-like protien